MKLRYGIVFGAIAIVLMMVSTAFAGIAPQFEEAQLVDEPAVDKVSIVENAVYVDPSICLTNSDLPRLREMLGETDDQDVRQSIAQIISLIERDGFATSEDISSIINTDSGINTASSGRIHISAKGCSGFARIKLGFKLWILTTIFYLAFLPHTATWDAHTFGASGEHIDVWVGNTHYTTSHHGTAYGFTGTIISQLITRPGGFIIYVFDIEGYASSVDIS